MNDWPWLDGKQVGAGTTTSYRCNQILKNNHINPNPSRHAETKEKHPNATSIIKARACVQVPWGWFVGIGNLSVLSTSNGMAEKRQDICSFSPQEGSLCTIQTRKVPPALLVTRFILC